MSSVSGSCGARLKRAAEPDTIFSLPAMTCAGGSGYQSLEGFRRMSERSWNLGLTG